MANYPLNLGVRFLLELTGLFALGYWGWNAHAGLARWAWALGLPLVAVILWGTLRVPNDPGKAPVSVPGGVRLLLEAAYFGGAVLAFSAAGRGSWALILSLVVLAHYLGSYDRVGRLIRNQPVR